MEKWKTDKARNHNVSLEPREFCYILRNGSEPIGLISHYDKNLSLYKKKVQMKKKVDSYKKVQ